MTSAIFFLVLLLSSSSLSGFQVVVGSVGGKGKHHVVEVSSLLPSNACSPSKGGFNINGSAMPVVHRHGPCSPLSGGAKLDPLEILVRDQLRVESLQSRISTRGRSRAQEPLRANSLEDRPPLVASYGASVNTANYIVTIGFGTPKKEMTVVFDTGSDLTWIQCEPCVSYCHPQKDPIFDPSESSSYFNISCTSPVCAQLKSSTGRAGACSSSNCVYGVQYGDQSYSVGFFATETVTLGSYGSIPGFRFGCGEKNRGIFGDMAGLLGLGRDKVSLVYQSANKFREVFSYCLPRSSSSTGYLSFGPTSYHSAVKFTPMVANDPPSYYFMDMVGIVVGGRKLPVALSVFSDSGTIIDSGTVITRLPPAAYSSLRTAFRRGMSQYPRAAALSILDTCYDLNGYKTVTIPKVVLVFRGGLEVEVVISGILYANGASQICLAFAGNSGDGDVGIFGNTQQRTYDVVYDVGKGRIGFGAGGCD